MGKLSFFAIALFCLFGLPTQYSNCEKSCRPNPCAYHCCKPNEFCWYDSDYRPRCEDPCATVRCKPGYQCKGEVGKCGTSACRPKARCRSPCENFKCPANSLCYSNTKNGKPQCVNACLSGCHSKCKAGYKCVTRPGACNDYSCPPVPHCYNPCDDVICEENNECWFNGTNAVCENPCAYTDCLWTFACLTKPGDCGDRTCPPKAECYRKYPPSSCEGINCGCRGQCSLVNTLQYPSVPICGKNPCINPPNPCCSVPTNNGKPCDADACYLEFKEGTCKCKKEACGVKQVCRDPCRVENVRCPVGTFCYKDQVECFTLPCNPVATCRQPCNATYGSVCFPDQKCQIIYVSCLGNDPYCKPFETCIPQKKKKLNHSRVTSQRSI